MNNSSKGVSFFKTLMKASSTNTSYEASFAADDKTKLASMEAEEDNFFYNKRTRECCGRNGASFMKTIAYLMVFAATVSAFFGLCLWVFYQTLDNYTPKLQTTSSFIGANPGLGYRPMLSVCFFFTKFTLFSKSHFHKIPIFKISFFTKFSLS